MPFLAEIGYYSIHSLQASKSHNPQGSTPICKHILTQFYGACHQILEFVTCKSIKSLLKSLQ